jgi:Flavin containing amine oxidoreductase
MAKKPDVDVAIIGGGVGGIYTGWRLLTSSLGHGQAAAWAAARAGGLKISVFEGSDRIGGRLLSARSPHLSDTTAEIGGMRYVVSGKDGGKRPQKLVQGLIETVLQLPHHEQVVSVDDNIAFLRGRLLRSAGLGIPSALPYWFDPAECAWLAARAGSNPSALIERVLVGLMPKIPERLKDGTLREYLETVEIDGLPLWRHGFWNLLARGMSPDGYNAARATVGYDCLAGNTNALDLTTEFFDFVPGVSYQMVDQGYEAVPWQLQQRFLAAGGQISFDRWLDGFVGAPLDDGAQGVKLNFRDGSALTARAVVLAMPRRSIELLRPEGEILGPQNAGFRHDLASVSGIPLFKLFLLYKQSWWQTAGVIRGRSLTDLPLRQCYYWPVGSTGTDAPKPDKPGLLMAYDDLMNVDFWDALDTRAEVHKAGLPMGIHMSHALPMFARKASSKAPAPDPFAERLLKNWEEHHVTKPMVDEMHRQLMQMHGVDSAPEPIDAAYMDWSRDPYGGGVHLWNVDYNSTKMLKHMTQPVAGFPCYICGEAYSTNQTWAEGALQTAEIVLHDRLGVPKADWQYG